MLRRESSATGTAPEDVLPDVYTVDCPAVLDTRALTVHVTRHEQEIAALRERLMTMERHMDRIANYVQGIGGAAEQRRALRESLDRADADLRALDDAALDALAAAWGAKC